MKSSVPFGKKVLRKNEKLRSDFVYLKSFLHKNGLKFNKYTGSCNQVFADGAKSRTAQLLYLANIFLNDSNKQNIQLFDYASIPRQADDFSTDPLITVQYKRTNGCRTQDTKFKH